MFWVEPRALNIVVKQPSSSQVPCHLGSDTPTPQSRIICLYIHIILELDFVKDSFSSPFSTAVLELQVMSCWESNPGLCSSICPLNSIFIPGLEYLSQSTWQLGLQVCTTSPCYDGEASTKDFVQQSTCLWKNLPDQEGWVQLPPSGDSQECPFLGEGRDGLTVYLWLPPIYREPPVTPCWDEWCGSPYLASSNVLNGHSLAMWVLWYLKRSQMLTKPKDASSTETRDGRKGRA